MIEEATTAAPRAIVLIATIPARKRSCERLLGELMRQTRKPDGVVLVLDGYGDAPAPVCPLPVIAEHRTAMPVGAGQRWVAVRDLPPDDIIINLDDDVMLTQAPKLVAALVAAIETGGGAAAAMGMRESARRAAPGAFSLGNLIYAAGCGLTVRVKHLAGLEGFAAEVKAAGGPDSLGLHGDDDAIVSAHLWKTGVRILHAATGNIFAATGTQSTSQTAARRARKEDPNAQKHAIKKITGWPGIAGPPARKVVGVVRR